MVIDVNTREVLGLSACLSRPLDRKRDRGYSGLDTS